jgi:hypothetical protein
MARVKRGVTSHAKHKKVLKAAKGFYGRRKNTIRVAKQAVEKSMQYSYRDRKNRKRTFRALWIQRLNAARARASVFAPDRRHGEGGHRSRPQGSLRHRHPRARGFRGDRCTGQGGAAPRVAEGRVSGSPRDQRARQRWRAFCLRHPHFRILDIAPRACQKPRFPATSRNDRSSDTRTRTPDRG